VPVHDHVSLWSPLPLAPPKSYDRIQSLIEDGRASEDQWRLCGGRHDRPRRAIIGPRVIGIFINRIFYYDSEPHEGNTRNPISKETVPCISPEKIEARRRFFAELAQMPFIALRRGVVKPRGWVLRMSYLKKLLASEGAAPVLTADDMRLSLTQKGVDMRIDIDVATLSLKKQVDRIILISGDLDMIPAMKLARRKGVQVAIVQVAGKHLSPELIEDSDIVREIKLIP
jgi:uncharacterized LabA/DUF88 family protein